ncbi:Histidine kinase [Lutibacter agarilyticus]|uniref:histidine kinase n=1 Tax=Lutibacter agarilyticus TaxID=1109740 RepID=A0A238VD82_9FLAO|nr:triple tyrosine motif-containing protein [Lutibacter agarilyticus]SNR32206.1 Histidine kinase [Lutibacter agarilyticus]
MFIKKIDYLLYVLFFISVFSLKAQENSVVENATRNTSFDLGITKVSWYNSKKDSTYNLTIKNKNLNSIELPYNNAFVGFEFSLPNHFKLEKNSFTYKFKGLHNDWRVLSETKILTFTNLPPGNYTLEVQATNNKGEVNENRISIPIIVHQIYYKQWWFICILMFLVLLLAVLIRKYEIYHIKKLEKLRLRIARDLHDELGSVLTGIAIRSELINENIDEHKRKEFLNDMMIQSRGAVDTLSDLVWAIDARNNSLQNLTDRMHNVLYQLLSPQNIKFTFKCFDSNKMELNQEHRQHIFLIYKEAITNIIKHSNATLVNISITKQKYNLKLTVKDNGTKFIEDINNLNGNGLQNMKARTEKIKGEIKFTHDNGFKVELLFDYLY